MADTKTTYMGMDLNTPILVAACSISSYTDRIKDAEKAGAGALVIRSLFEEQILFESLRMEEELSRGSELYAEALSYFPQMHHGEASEHLMWVEKARAEVKMPLIASLNAINPGTWTKYAKQLENTGVDALELNVYSVVTNVEKSAADVEKSLYETVDAVLSEVKIPVSVKLSPYYSSTANVAAQLAKRGVQGLVLFNRFLQPDIDTKSEELINEMIYSTPQEMKLPLRWVAILYNQIKADLALNTGVHSGLDSAKAILAGASVIQSASALLQNGIAYISTMLRELEGWMDEHGYNNLSDFRGKLSQSEVDDPLAFERAQYVKLLMSQK